MAKAAAARPVCTTRLRLALAIVAVLAVGLSNLRSATRSLTSTPPATARRSCEDMSRGEWVQDGGAPYYTNDTCPFIEKRHDCIGHGKPSLDFIGWRWQPGHCHLPRFDARRFLKAARNKTMAFVGDSFSRNQLQSLTCLLFKEEQPEVPPDIPWETVLFFEMHDGFLRLHYPTSNFTLRLYWSQFLVRFDVAVQPSGTDQPGLFKLYLDEPDTNWAPHVADFDYLIVSAMNWMSRPSLYFQSGRLVGCYSCGNNSVTTRLPPSYAHRAAFRTALGHFMRHNRRNGTAVVRTVTPNHFENGAWNAGGDCVRTRPFRSNETVLKDPVLSLYRGQLQVFQEAKEAASEHGVTVELLNVTEPMTMRPDAHPGKHWRFKHEWPSLASFADCIHWCLPGAVDMWNEWLLHRLFH